MKIERMNGPATPLETGKSNRHSGKTSFADFLDKAMEKECSPVSDDIVSGDVAPLAEPINPTINSVHGQVIERASHLLDLMENYAEALRDPERSLKSIEPIVRRIDQELKDLRMQAKGIDHGIANLANEIAVTAQVETMKFDRGDYVA